MTGIKIEGADELGSPLFRHIGQAVGCELDEGVNRSCEGLQGLLKSLL
jgi:hypothetical protein